MSADLLRLMSTIGLSIALAVIALGLMTATLNRLRDFAVLKALGARTRRLAGAIAMQVVLTVALAAGVATIAALALGWLLPVVAPTVQISITKAAVAKTTASALVVGLLAALWPLRRIAALDAATALQGDTMNNNLTPSSPVLPTAAPAGGPAEHMTRGGVPAQPPLLTVRGLTKTYGAGETSVDAVRAVDLDVPAGEVLLVMGQSGSGKTTLLLMLGALLRPTAGSITVTTHDGGTVNIAAAPEKQLPVLRASTFGFIFQDYALLDALTATENIAVAANLAGTTGATAHQRALKLLDRVSLSHRAAARPLQMSGGEQQRVAVARALANDPPVLLADEPTANLDASRGRDLARLLRRLADDDRRSVILVSHDERLHEVADRVLWLEDGAFRQLAALAVDPVRRMQVEPSGPQATWGGPQ